MYDSGPRSAKGQTAGLRRILLRPTVRGKAGKPVGFGSEQGAGICGGWTRLAVLPFGAYNEMLPLQARQNGTGDAGPLPAPDSGGHNLRGPKTRSGADSLPFVSPARHRRAGEGQGPGLETGLPERMRMCAGAECVQPDTAGMRPWPGHYGTERAVFHSRAVSAVVLNFARDSALL